MIAPTKEDIDPLVVAEVARHLFHRERPVLERVPHGVSTYVYRVYCRDTTHYLRVFRNTCGTFAPEVRVHALLRQRGVRVPEVLHFEPCHDLLGRSIMVTTAIEGRSITTLPPVEARDVLLAAGRDLAVVNTIAVDGFGWIERDGAAETVLKGRFTSHREFILNGLDQHLEVLARAILQDSDVDVIRGGIQRYACWLDVPRACLAHGDFLTRHIFARGRRYTGIIDFSAIQGTGSLYDLARFAIYDRDASRLPPVLAGYQQVTKLGSDLSERLTFLGLLIALGPLARHVSGPAANKREHPAYRAIMSALEWLRQRPRPQPMQYGTPLTLHRAVSDECANVK